MAVDGCRHELIEYVVQNHSLISSSYILDELKNQLSRKFHLTREEVR